MRLLFKLGISLLIALAMAASGAHATQPEGIVLALTPSKDPTLLQEAGVDLAKVLSKSLGLPVKVYVASDYAGVIEALRNKTVDLAFVHPTGYVLANREARAQILVKATRGGSAFYTSRIYVRKDSDIQSLEDLRGRTIAFVDPASTSGYIYPMALLMKKGLVKGKDPKTFFKEAVFSGTHEAALFAVLNRQVDAAAVFDHAPERRVKDPEKVAQLRYIAETEKIPNDGAAVRDGLSPELVARTKAALLDLNSPEGRPLLMKLYAIDGLVEARDADFDPVREAVDLLGLAVKKTR